MKLTFVASVGLGLVLCLVVTGVSQGRFRSPGEALPKAPSGTRHPDMAMAQARNLMKAYQNANGDWSKVDRELLYLDDQKLAEEPMVRAANAFLPLRHSLYRGKVAFFAETYTAKNLAYASGDIVTSRPSGFYIVGYSDGQVKQVPVGEVRWMHFVEDGDDVWRHVFPGMPEYAGSDSTPGKKKEASK